MPAPYAEVVVNRPIVQRRAADSALPAVEEWSVQHETRLKRFHYHIPPHLAAHLQPGHLVAVPFRRQELQGVVVALSDDSPVEKTRPIHAILDPNPVVTPAQIALARWLANEYLAPLTTCLSYFLSPGANRRPVTVIEVISPPPSPPPTLTPREQALYLYLQQQAKPVPLEGLEAGVVAGLQAKRLVQKRATLSKPGVGPKIERTVELLISPDEFEATLDTLGRPSKQAAALQYLARLDDPLPTVQAVKEAVGCSDSPLKGLADKGWADYLPAQKTIVPAPGAALSRDAPPPQAQILARLQAHARPILQSEFEAVTGHSLRQAKPLFTARALAYFREPPRLALRLPRHAIPDAIAQLRGTERHAAVLNLLAAEDGPVWIGWIYAQTEATAKTLQDLARAQAIAFDEARRWRDPLAEQTFTLDRPPTLTPEQAAIMAAIAPAVDRPGKPFLIHGVTGSGKTEIYLQAIQLALKKKRGVLFLVPEITLATQIVRRVQARFPGRVAVWHSSLSPGERFDTWERVRNGDLPIVVGPRSALFAPLQQPGLIVIDEEHEPAYKQDRTPTYHARDAALEYARLTNIPVIMGSATPDVVSYRKAQRGEYQLLRLPDRILAHAKHVAVQRAMLKKQPPPSSKPANGPDKAFVTLPMPPVTVVDLREELKAGNRSIFSRALSAAIRRTLSAGEQVILFLNRRGTATFVICRDCGYVSRCPRCDTTLTFHAPNRQLACHYCGFRTNVPQTCPDCGRQRIRYFGLGTERVEAALRRAFPQARPIRLDYDTTRARGSHYTLLQQFVEGQANVMIGTQMVAKGLDLPLVTLVGVISADTALYLPEFRAAERTLQVLMQVAGRAGRSPLGGRVILQTYTPDQPAIVAAAAHNYLAFYNDELRFRYEQGYPPFKRLARLTYSGRGKTESRAAAQAMADRLQLWVDRQGFPAVEIIGPTPTYVQRLRTHFRWQILVRAPDPAQILRPVPLPLDWRVDIDPVNLL